MKTFLFLCLSLFFAAPLSPQIGEHMSHIQGERVVNSIVVNDSVLNEVLIYNFEDSICTSIIIFCASPRSQLYERLIRRLYVCGNSGTWTEIKFSSDISIFKIYSPNGNN